MSNLEFEENGFWYYRILDGFSVGFEEGENNSLIKIYNGKIQCSTTLPTDINKAKKVLELCLSAIDRYEKEKKNHSS